MSNPITKIWSTLTFWNAHKPTTNIEDQAARLVVEQIKTCSVLLYMNGTPESTNCKYSAAAVRAIQKTGFSFSYIDVTEMSDLVQTVPKVSNYDKFPQLFIGGQFVGGCNTILEMLDHGTLDMMIEDVLLQPARSSRSTIAK